ncbi:hypothetical protein [Rhizobium paknamense]|uniref:Tetratricopeptide (TPR) repeat protein n=1 Tax=Rhizobium paknamense TaxID=1206817 RepID=A0ABU0ICC4_9HYPH|nr:hypothetical protein [Rhizobium paknamense]MDQ0455894.1 tetratricopeptide (TPR) repeat protein [Rhizobium paknamense]
MTVWHELGLEPTSDERAIKKAYALKLKTVRPDEDPQGFQRLNECYKAALAMAKEGLRRAEEQSIQSVSVAISLPEDLDNPVEPAPAHAPEQTERKDAPKVRLDSPEPEIEQSPFRLDLNSFLRALLRHIKYDDLETFQQWLSQETASWPISLKTYIANDVLDALMAQEQALELDKFDHVVTFFQLNDVLIVRNPMRLSLYRKELERAAGILSDVAPEAPTQKQSRKPKWKRIMVALCGFALLYAYVFIMDNDNGGSQTNGDIDRPFVEKFTYSPLDQLVMESLAKAETLASEGKIEEALQLYRKAAFPAQDAMQAKSVTAYALYGLGIQLTNARRYDEARDIYDRLYRDYAGYRGEDTDIIVSSGMVNLALLYFGVNDLDHAFSTYGSIISIYQDNPKPWVALQVAKARIGQVEVSLNKGNAGLARILFDRFNDRYSSSRDPAIRDLFMKAQTLHSKINAGQS